uniref:Cyclin-K n=1 Tax=Cuerna arida TaxID=1464854 RepID=A0A1B6GSV6_9HEMI
MDPNCGMPCWYFEKKELRNTPSVQDGIEYETECRYRKEGARFIIDTGTKMDLGYNTMATGVVYFHRFYMYHSFRNFPRYVTACCCLFLAGKVEETPKKCKDIIKTAKGLLTEQKYATFGEDPKEEVMTLERILLQTIKFDLQVEHPYSFLLKYAKSLKGDKQKLHKMVQMAWTFVNDSLCTTLCLQWEPEVIAVALMYLAGKLSKFEVVDWVGRHSKHLRWWDMFVEDITMDLLEDICHQVLDLYSQPQNAQAPESPPLVRNPPLKKEQLPPTPFVVTPQHSSPIPPAAIQRHLEPNSVVNKTREDSFPSVTPNKVIKSELKTANNGEKIPTVTGGVVSDNKVSSGEVYGYSGYTQPPASAFPPAFTTTRPPPYPYPATATHPTSYYPPPSRPPY